MYNFQLCGGYSLLNDWPASVGKSLLIGPLLTYIAQVSTWDTQVSTQTKLSLLASDLVYLQHFPPERFLAGWVTGRRSALRRCLCPLLNTAFPHRPLVTSLHLCRKRVGEGWLCPLRLFTHRQASSAGAQRPAHLIIYSRLCLTRSPSSPGHLAARRCRARVTARQRYLLIPGSLRRDRVTDASQAPLQSSSQRMAISRSHSRQQDPGPSARAPYLLR